MSEPSDDQRRAVLSIDLGASFTKIAWRPRWDVLREPNQKLIPFDTPSISISIDGESAIPSLAFDTGRGRWVFGKEAAMSNPVDFEGVSRNWKRDLFEINLTEDRLAIAMNVAKRYLRWLKDKIPKTKKLTLEELNDSKLRLCVPAFQNELDNLGRSRLKAAATEAGWLQIHFETEPECNIIGWSSGGQNHAKGYYYRHPFSIEVDYRQMFDRIIPEAARTGRARFGIIDVGSFTTDVAVVIVKPDGVFQVEQQQSFAHGVSALDQILLKKIRALGLTFNENEFNIAKERIYSAKPYNTVIGSLPIEIEADYMRKDIESFSGQVFELCRGHLSDCNWFALTGGGMEIPLARDTVGELLKAPNRRDVSHFCTASDHRLATALGGASILFDVYSQNPGNPPPPLPPPPLHTNGTNCTCNGLNKDCTRCGGTGWVDSKKKARNHS